MTLLTEVKAKIVKEVSSYLVQNKIFSLPIRPENKEVKLIKTLKKLFYFSTILLLLFSLQRSNSLVEHPPPTEPPKVATLGARRKGRHRWNILK